ncbi:MAG: glycosyltransferase family 4 protein [Chitinophagaceae bacterium]|jgi:glycosyltransferase involved in cell wall biosynthesis|nr:glycosyltransferase family 4 protein [Chitinophagaceae bacterium]
MKLGFYYHIPIKKNGARLYAPSYLSVFISELSMHVDELVLFMHEATELEKIECDGLLLNKNISWVNLGNKTPAWHRVFFHKRLLKPGISKLFDCDILLVRSPTPLAPFFGKYLKKVQIVFMIVGDNDEVALNMEVNNCRQIITKYFIKYNQILFEKQIAKSRIVVNSPQLLEKYKFIAPKIQLIKTTTLGVESFFFREDTCNKPIINILYTGRIDIAKGLFELLEAISVLRSQNFNVILNIVGKEINDGNEIINLLIVKAKKLNIEKYLIFHGWKSLGFGLNEMYQKSDIYVIPSYHEGFPRTIWEAMANSLPVIASDVGAIPFYLKNEISALIIKPKEIDSLVIAIKRIIQNKKLRKKIIENGFKLAKKATQEKQMKILFEYLK